MEEIKAVDDWFEIYRDMPGAVYPVPAYADDKEPLTIAVGKMGGGSLDRKYVGSWTYAIVASGDTIYSGTDVESHKPIDHAEAARILIVTLLNMDGLYDQETALIKVHGARLQAWLDASFSGN